MLERSTAHDDLARWILDREISTPEGAIEAVAQRACQKLYTRLASLITMAGTQAFLDRALHMARAEFPSLDGLRAGSSPDTCLDGIDEALRGLGPEEAREVLVSVFANLIELLVTFIGEHLTLHVVRDIWPDAPLARARRQEEPA